MIPHFGVHQIRLTAAMFCLLFRGAKTHLNSACYSKQKSLFFGHLVENALNSAYCSNVSGEVFPDVKKQMFSIGFTCFFEVQKSISETVAAVSQIQCFLVSFDGISLNLPYVFQCF